MKRLLHFLALSLAFTLMTPVAYAAEASPPPAAATTNVAENRAAQELTERERTTAAVAASAAVAATHPTRPPVPGLLEHLVDAILGLFNVRSNESTVTHYVISGLLLVAALLLRRVVTGIIFRQLKRVAAKTETTLDDKLFPAIEPPVATFIMLVGIFAAFSVLKLSLQLDRYLDYASTVAFSLTIFWGLFRAFGAVLDHGQEVAVHRNLGIAAFMPWIKKTLMVIFSIIGVLMVIQSLGYGENVKTVLAGLGIGSLAFALAAQDTIANLFGSIVIAIDQPFKIGEAIRIGPNEGVVEDIGLRSTKLRTPGKNLVIIPNKVTAAEPIINNSRFIRRRVEQVIGLTYDATPDQMAAIVGDIRRLLGAESEIDGASILVFFRDFNASSLDIWIAYETPNPDFAKHMAVKERMNLAIMRAVEAHKLAFAFPSQTVYLAGDVAERLAPRPGVTPTSAPPTSPSPRA